MSTQRDSTTDKRQKNQYRLAFAEESRGAAPMACEGGTESALRRVKANKGSPGIDGMTVEELSGHQKERWPAIREQPFS